MIKVKAVLRQKKRRTWMQSHAAKSGPSKAQPKTPTTLRRRRRKT